MKSTDVKLAEENQDDYSEILPLFIYPDEDRSKTLFPDMDLIIEKCSEAIDRHSIYIKKEEHNKWVDDCYTLIGKARFYKHEYYVGIEIFEYLVKLYNKQPEKFDALIWLAKSHMELNEMSKAESYLRLMEGGQAPPEKYNSHYNAVYADFLIRSKKYDEAIFKLEKALETTKKRTQKQRYKYVLAQLWLKKKEFGKAAELFSEVIKLKPRYEMMFNAQISRALSFDVGGDNQDDIKKMLTKMMNDAKNKEFLDQIYYALADIAFKEGDEPLGIDYLQRSAAASINNQKQKALSYLRLGELFYDKPEYVPAQAYYDSCMAVIPKEYKDYDEIYLRSTALNDLVKNIVVIEREDSLQKMAGDESYRDAVIQELIEAEKERIRKEEELANSGGGTDLANFNSINTQSNGKWYFYNQSTLGFGFADFKKNWGTRKLEDNWRRSDKQTVLNFEEEENLNDSTANDSVPENPKLTPEYYLKSLPNSEEQLNASHNMIIEAFYNLGNIYREDFQDYPRALNSFETLLERYDTCRYKLPSWYNLYRISLLTMDDNMRNKYRDLIVDTYPESEYARIIQDPTYNKVTRENRKRVDNYYNRVFDLYKSGKYSLVLVRCEKAKAIFADNHIQDRFDFIATLAVGQTQPVDTFKVALKNIVNSYPDSDVSREAQNILNLIGKQKVNNPNTPKTVEYDYKPEDEYTFVAVIPSTDKKTTKYKVDVSNFNSKSFSQSNFTVSSIFLNGLNQIITVKGIKNEEEATTYLKAFGLDQNYLGELNGKKYQYFFISADNFITFYKDKNIQTYLKFYKEQFNIE